MRLSGILKHSPGFDKIAYAQTTWGVFVMTDVINVYFHADSSFVTSPVFYFLVVGPFLCLFIVRIVCELKNKGRSHKRAG